MYCLNKFDGIPIKKDIAYKQFYNFIADNKKRSSFLWNGYIILKRHDIGLYKGLLSTFHYVYKPKNAIAIYKIK